MFTETTVLNEGKPSASVMRLVESKPNPAGGFDQLFLLQGAAFSTPISVIDHADILPKLSGAGTLRLFHFNDLHNHLTELSGSTKGTHRFSQMVQRVRRARVRAERDETVLFLSIGDDHTGSVFDELLGWKADQFVLDASYRAYSDAGLDATVLGNHEFDRGAELLALGIRQDAKFPVLSANAHSSAHLKSGQDYFPAAIGICGNLRVGLVGLTTHIETRVGQPNDPNFAVASPILTLNNLLPALDPLVDVILIMSHCGFGDGAHKSGKAAASRDIGEADFSIARAAAGLTKKPTLVLGAHTHTKLNENGLESENTFAGIPIFQTECNGKYLGEIELEIRPGSLAENSVKKACLHPIKPKNAEINPDDPDFHTYEQPENFDHDFEKTTIAPLIDQVKTISANVIAHVATENLSFRSAVLERYAQESALLNFMCDAMVERMDQAGLVVDFAMMNGATVQAGVEPGSLNMGAWYDVMPYADEVFVLSFNGLELNKMLQSNAQRILRSGEILTTDYHGFLPRGFLHTSRHIRYQIDPGASAQLAQAREIKIDGEPIALLEDRIFKAAVPTYLALGAFGEHWNGRPICGGVPGDLAGYDLRQMNKQNTGLVFRDEIAAHIVSKKILDQTSAPAVDGRLHVLENSKGCH